VAASNRDGDPWKRSFDPAGRTARRLSRQHSRSKPETADINETGRLLGVGRSMVYELIGNGTLPSLQIGKRRLVRRSAIRQLVAELEHAGTSKVA
jgi:excisionase family DNA binding protein